MNRPMSSRAVLAPVSAAPHGAAGADSSGKGCLYPLWPNDAAPTHEYCGVNRQDGSSYCADHHAICYVPVPKRTGRKFDLLPLGETG